jgi:hypothetical protein
MPNNVYPTFEWFNCPQCDIYILVRTHNHHWNTKLNNVRIIQDTILFFLKEVISHSPLKEKLAMTDYFFEKEQNCILYLNTNWDGAH